MCVKSMNGDEHGSAAQRAEVCPRCKCVDETHALLEFKPGLCAQAELDLCGIICQS